MNEQLIQAIESFNNEAVKTEKAETAISTLVSCFGETLVDVTKEKLEEDNVSEYYIESHFSGSNQIENIVNYFKASVPYWRVVIKFPHEIITNEFGKKVDIYDFFIRLNLKYDGTLMYTSAIKATFTEDQLLCGYVHSHCPSLRQDVDGIREWKSMCFGSGPINGTMMALRRPDYDDRLWVPFTSELRQWVRTESTDGGPYFRMEYIHSKYEKVKRVPSMSISYQDKRWLTPLLKSYINAKRLKFGFAEGRYHLGTTFTEWLIDFSKYAQVWGKKNSVTIPTVDTLILNNAVYEKGTGDTTTSRITNLIGRQVLTFKGTPVLLKSIPSENVEHMSLIDYKLGVHIIKNILTVINYKYGRHEENDIPLQWG